jgi:hypothetical protein
MVILHGLITLSKLEVYLVIVLFLLLLPRYFASDILGFCGVWGVTRCQSSSLSLSLSHSLRHGPSPSTGGAMAQPASPSPHVVIPHGGLGSRGCNPRRALRCHG